MTSTIAETLESSRKAAAHLARGLTLTAEIVVVLLGEEAATKGKFARKLELLKNCLLFLLHAL